MSQTVKDFITDSYQLVSSSSPTVPLYGNDMSKGVQILNLLLSSYSASALNLTIAKHISFTLPIAVQELTFGAPTYVPTPDVTEGRLANLQNIWLLLQGVTYPLIIENRNTFFQSYKFDPQVGLPRFAIVTNEINLTRIRFYPAASQVYSVEAYGKFEIGPLTENDDMSVVPDYYQMYLQFAVAKRLAAYKGRSQAWSELNEKLLQEYEDEIRSASSMNLNIETQEESYLNGRWRVVSGV